ncbi:MAG: DUF1294 domain-containing protein [Oscillospiraceae bacterium]|nr:DUF1294 domain-containing protein [Oscillospiraceae bacterium]
MKYFIIYLIIMNAVGFVTMGVDKYRAMNRDWRLSEKLLLGIAVLGGSIGSICGMVLFRHKTKHLQFHFGLPAILVLQIIIGIVVLCVK